LPNCGDGHQAHPGRSAGPGARRSD
jgi:hypothetical protein